VIGVLAIFDFVTSQYPSGLGLVVDVVSYDQARRELLVLQRHVPRSIFEKSGFANGGIGVFSTDGVWANTPVLISTSKPIVANEALKRRMITSHFKD
jgi:hypothetical protein